MIIFPLVLLSIWIASRAVGDESDGWGRGSLYYFLTLGPMIAIGAAVHQLLLVAVPLPTESAKRARGLAIVLTPVFPLVLLVTGSSPAMVFSVPIILPLLVGGVLYGSAIELGHQ